MYSFRARKNIAEVIKPFTYESDVLGVGKGGYVLVIAARPIAA